jgi:PTS system nitrogen regulatory IIA component
MPTRSDRAIGRRQGRSHVTIDHVESLSPASILVGITAPDKYALIERLVTQIAETGALEPYPELTCEAVYSRVKKREDEHATGLERGVAFPHARIPGLQGLMLALAILDEPVDFQARDGISADFAVLMLVPDDQPTLALTCMAQLSKVLSNPVYRTYLRHEKNPVIIHDFILSELRRAPNSVTAGQLMRHPMVDIYPETPIRDVTRTMAELHLDTIAVVDHDSRLLGEITCQHLAQLGIPEFFSKLKTVSFLSEFDPLEKYFEKERSMVAADVMLDDYAAVEEEATLLEVIFQLAIRRHAKVHVIREGRRVGVIDWNLMLNRVINI